MAGFLSFLGFGGSGKRDVAFWAPVTVDGETSPGGQLEPGAHYLSIAIEDFKLTRSSSGTTSYAPIVVAEATAPQAIKRLSQSGVVSLEDVLDGKEIKGSRDLAPESTTVCSQLPWYGELEGNFKLISVRSEERLKMLLGLRDEFASVASAFGGEEEVDEGDVPDGAHDEVYLPDEDEGTLESLALVGAVTAKVASKAASIFVKKVSVNIATKLASALVEKDGELEIETRAQPPQAGFAPGYYVLWRGRAGSQPNFTYDPASRELRADGRKVKRSPYIVIRAIATDRHRNIEDIPKVGAAYEQLHHVALSYGNVEAAQKSLDRAIQLSPYLISSDKERLRSLVKHEIEDLESNQNESIAGAIHLFRTLRELWDEVGRNLPDATSDAPTSPDITTDTPADIGGEGSGDEQVAGADSQDSGGETRFHQSLAFSLRWEGGFSDVEGDAGGRTNHGVTEAVYHEWLDGRGLPRKPVEQITEEEYMAIYYGGYWIPPRCDRMIPPLDLVVFDASINHGPGGAGSLLQRSLKAKGQNVVVDGAVGPATLAAVKQVDQLDLCEQYLSERRAFYHRLVDRKPTQSKFLKGWLNRVADLENVIGLGTLESDIIPENTPFAEYFEE